MAEKEVKVAEESSLVRLARTNKLTEELTAVGDRERGGVFQEGIQAMLPSTGEKRFFDRGLGRDAKVSPHQIKKDRVDAELTKEVRVAVEQLTVLDRSVCVGGRKGGGLEERGQRDNFLERGVKKITGKEDITYTYLREFLNRFSSVFPMPTFINSLREPRASRNLQMS